MLNICEHTPNRSQLTIVAHHTECELQEINAHNASAATGSCLPDKALRRRPGLEGIV
jgi:hypothetical protein